MSFRKAEQLSWGHTASKGENLGFKWRQVWLLLQGTEHRNPGHILCVSWRYRTLVLEAAQGSFSDALLVPVSFKMFLPAPQIHWSLAKGDSCKQDLKGPLPVQDNPKFLSGSFMPWDWYHDSPFWASKGLKIYWSTTDDIFSDPESKAKETFPDLKQKELCCLYKKIYGSPLWWITKHSFKIMFQRIR